MDNTRFMRTLAYKNKNPLNVRYDPLTVWQGQAGKAGGFVTFTSFSLGYRAAVLVLRSYARRGITTLGQIIGAWAPPRENGTPAYTLSVISYMSGVRRTTPKEYNAGSPIDLRDREETVSLLMAMTRVEMGANTARQHALKDYAYIGYDLAATRKDFFDGVPPTPRSDK